MAASRTAKRAAGAADNGLQPDWWSKSLAGVVPGLALAFALSGLIAWLAPGGIAAPDMAQFAMWIVAPIWMTLFACVYLFRSGLRAWLWLGGAAALAHAALLLLRMAGG